MEIFGKQSVAILLTLACLLAFSGCGSGSSSEEGAEGESLHGASGFAPTLPSEPSPDVKNDDPHKMAFRVCFSYVDMESCFNRCDVTLDDLSQRHFGLLVPDPDYEAALYDLFSQSCEAVCSGNAELRPPGDTVQVTVNGTEIEGVPEALALSVVPSPKIPKIPVEPYVPEEPDSEATLCTDKPSVPADIQPIHAQDPSLITTNPDLTDKGSTKTPDVEGGNCQDAAGPGKAPSLGPTALTVCIRAAVR